MGKKTKISDFEKVLVAKEVFQQWCEDDADIELEQYNENNNTELSFEMSDEDLQPFYVDLYNKGLRM